MRILSLLTTLLLLTNTIFAETVADIPFDEGWGTIAEDYSGFTNSAFLENGTSWSSDQEGAMIEFDGIDDVIRIPESSELNIQDEFTISFWINTTESRLTPSTRHREILFRKGSNLIIGYERDKVDEIIWLRCYVRYSDKRTQEVEYRDDKSDITRDGQWHHIKIVFEKDVRLELYIDEELVDSEAPKSSTGVKLSPNNNDYILGGREKNSGTIDRNINARFSDLIIKDHAEE